VTVPFSSGRTQQRIFYELQDIADADGRWQQIQRLHPTNQQSKVKSTINQQLITAFTLAVVNDIDSFEHLHILWSP